MSNSRFCLFFFATLIHCSVSLANPTLWKLAHDKNWAGFEHSLKKTPQHEIDINFAPNDLEATVLALIPDERRRQYYLNPIFGPILSSLGPFESDGGLAHFLDEVANFRFVLSSSHEADLRVLRGLITREILSRDLLPRQTKQETFAILRLVVPTASILESLEVYADKNGMAPNLHARRDAYNKSGLAPLPWYTVLNLWSLDVSGTN